MNSEASLPYIKFFHQFQDQTLGFPLLLGFPSNVTNQEIIQTVWERVKKHVPNQPNPTKSPIVLHTSYSNQHGTRYHQISMEGTMTLRDETTNFTDYAIKYSCKPVHTEHYIYEYRTEMNTPEKKRVSLFDCLNLFLKKEKLSPENMWYCPHCKKHQEATKQFELYNLPQILVIHLKR